MDKETDNIHTPCSAVPVMQVDVIVWFHFSLRKFCFVMLHILTLAMYEPCCLLVVVGNAKYLKGKSEDEQHKNEIEKLRKKVDRYRNLIEHTQKLYKVMNSN